jgi:hypothetical protein
MQLGAVKISFSAGMGQTFLPCLAKEPGDPEPETPLPRKFEGS